MCECLLDLLDIWWYSLHICNSNLNSKTTSNNAFEGWEKEKDIEKDKNLTVSISLSLFHLGPQQPAPLLFPFHLPCGLANKRSSSRSPALSLASPAPSLLSLSHRCLGPTCHLLRLPLNRQPYAAQPAHQRPVPLHLHASKGKR